MRYCRNKILDRKIRDLQTAIWYWEHRGEDRWGEIYIMVYKNAVRRIEKLKNR